MTMTRAGFALIAATLLALAQGFAFARETAPAPDATLEALFTPGDAIDARLAALIEGAQQEVLVNAFSFTSRRIARALAAAHARGVRVELVADRTQALELPGSAVPALVRDGVSVWLDGNFAAAHNKVMIIDESTLITGSFNFTVAAQKHNAENLLLISGKPELIRAYRSNWLAHQAHSVRLQ